MSCLYEYNVDSSVIETYIKNNRNTKLNNIPVMAKDTRNFFKITNNNKINNELVVEKKCFPCL